MSPARSFQSPRCSANPSLEAALPAQETAKAVLGTEFAVFLARRDSDSLASRPVLLWGNHPGRMPAALVGGLAEQAGLPWVEVPAGPGFCPDEVVSRLARRARYCREGEPLGVALVSDLQDLPLPAVCALAAHLEAPGHVPHWHLGRVLNLARQQVFWVCALRVKEPSRLDGRSETGAAGTSFALLAVGPSSADVVAAGVAGPFRSAGGHDTQADALTALGQAFPANALLLPGTVDDLTAWAGDESAPWWPGRRMRAFCAHHGVDFRMASGAVEVWAAEAARHGGTVDALEECLRLGMDPVLALIADHSRDWAAVEVTAGALAQTEGPRLVAGPRRTVVPPAGPARSAGAAGAPGTVGGGVFERPPRTPHSSPDIRLARAEDLHAVLETRASSLLS